MRVEEVNRVLAALHIQPPELEVLQATEASYTSLLLQPSGPILGGAARIGALDADVSAAKTLAFAGLARNCGAHLAVTPEYFAPWSALMTLLTTGVTPLSGCLWILGCESITADALTQFKNEAPANCEVIFEPLGPLRADRPLLDPVALLFNSKRSDGQDCLVVLVQFKTFPSRDNLFLEEAALKRGTTVYCLGGEHGQLSLVTLICSDALDIDANQIRDLVDRSTIVHIQLNPAPRNGLYRQYRTAAFRIDARASECHIVCLNWARSIVQHDDAGDSVRWPAVGGSAWYLPKESCAQSDEVVLPNHGLGLYYTYMKEHRHALVLHYDEAVFECRVPKVITHGAAVMANRNGPSGVSRYEWDAGNSSWSAQAGPPSGGFTEMMAADPDAAAALPSYGTQTPLNIERLLALTVGKIASGDGWRLLSTIDSFQMESDELVNRMTFVQDPEDGPRQFRHRRLLAAAELRHELNRCDRWPPQIQGVGPASRIEWDAEDRPFNIHGDGVRPALVCFLGDGLPPRDIENIASKLIDLLRRQGGAHHRRLCIAYRRYGELVFDPLSGLTRYDEALLDERDILSADTE